MDPQEIAKGALGSFGKYDVEFKDGGLSVEVDGNAGPGSVGLVIKIDAGKVIDALEKAIPGIVDDAILELVRKGLGAGA